MPLRRRLRAAALAALIGVAALSAAAPTVSLASPTPDPNSDFGKTLGIVVQPAPPPPFPVLLADGSTTSIAAYSGKVLLASFWATWCPYCHREMPKLAKAQAALGGAMTVLPLSLDSGDLEEATAKIRRFYSRRGVDGLPVMIDAGQMNANYVVARVTPTTLVINKEGLVVAVAQGPADWTSKAALDYLRAPAAE